jgi:hypothetical protein
MYGDVEVPWVYPYAEPNAEPSSRQFRRFAEKARELGCPEYSARFDEVLRRIIPNRSLHGIDLGPRARGEGDAAPDRAQDRAESAPFTLPPVPR